MINSFIEAKEFMSKSQNAYYRKIHKTLMVEKLADSHPNQERYGIRYYHTVIVKYYEPNFVTLNSGGYRSSFTNKLLNKYGPKNLRVYQRKYQLYFTFNGAEEGCEYVFFDGITFTEDGKPANFNPDDLNVTKMPNLEKLLSEVK